MGGRICHALPGQSVKVAIDLDKVLRLGFVETEPETQRPVRAWALRADADLPRQACLLPGHRKNAARAGNGFLGASLYRAKVLGQVLRCALVEVRLLAKWCVHVAPRVCMSSPDCAKAPRKPQ